MKHNTILLLFIISMVYRISTVFSYQSDNIEIENNVGVDVSIDCGDDIECFAEKKAIEYGIDPQILYRMIKKESTWKVDAKSKKGARGLMQIMPFNAEKCGIDTDDLWNYKKNIECGLYLLKTEIDHWESVYPNDKNYAKKLAFASYNAGRGVAKKALVKYKETRNYVNYILGD